ncbi:MAG: hypothetical protein OEX01_08960 [Candidatus Bathyarchaeota archaeon]|nr:hypothetical protein [Candidatus Bathyarchaeota archaeon]
MTIAVIYIVVKVMKGLHFKKAGSIRKTIQTRLTLPLKRAFKPFDSELFFDLKATKKTIADTIPTYDGGRRCVHAMEAQKNFAIKLIYKQQRYC